jgi:hypothetical protein
MTTVVHVQDLENGLVYTNGTGPNAVFLRRGGTLKQLQ